MAANYLAQLKALSEEIQESFDVMKEENTIEESPGNSHKEWPKQIKKFFSELNGVDIHWQSYKDKKKLNISGRIHLLSSEKVAMDTKDVVWFNHTPENSILRKFKIIDFFVDEAAVGFIENDATGQLYFYEFAGEPQPLGVAFDGYVQLLCMCKGFFYWQKSLLEMGTKTKELQETKDMKQHLPNIFPDFNFDAFTALFQKVRLHKK